ncbi:NADP-dependent oxidoreductase [Microbacterium sp. STN6]|uniref:quinone oxidoreductase family protein n=1 Tax=Microbacterium sp. STN6 TaxID=2995588 RepID=UPI002260EC5F|nr:NADP-dependent oxidoreductase [Microbacterium sp. STN6]MCX7521427.1 NADP-dependent oxidoreductase [Microbacterium sp. STN6]
MAKRWVAADVGGLDRLRMIDAEVPPPATGKVTIDVRAVGMNPADFKHISAARNPIGASATPLPIGYEVAGVVAALGDDTEIASGGGAVGDEVLAFRVTGGYATRLNVPARDVFAKPASLDFPQAANLLLAGATAADMLHTAEVTAGETIVVHGASGAVGVSILQQAHEIGARVVGTAGRGSFDVVRRYGGEPVEYGDGLLDRLRAALPGGTAAAALDCVGTDEAVDASLALVGDRRRVITIVASGRAADEGFVALGGRAPDSAAYRDRVRPQLIRLAAEGRLEVPIARTFGFDEAVAALQLLSTGHPGGKLALIP